MRTCLDVRGVTSPKGGIGRYATSLVRELGKERGENEYVLLYHPLASREFWESIVEKKENFSFCFFSFPRFSLGGIFLLSSFLKRERIEIFHSFDFLAPFFFKGKIVITIHDLIPYLFPRKFISLKKRLFPFYKFLLHYSIKRADFVVVPSYSTRKDILNHFKIPPSRLRIIPEGVEKKFSPVKKKETLERVRKKYSLPQKYILHVGGMEPNKNLPFLIQAFGDLKKTHPECKLVVAGEGKREYKEKLTKLVKLLSLEKEVLFLGEVEEEDLPGIYTLSSLFVFPSRYEGFGLPPLEAMACGTPVVTSNTSSLPEVVREGALMVDPCQREELTWTMKRVLEKETLRKELKERGLKRAKNFSWEKTAKEIRNLWKELQRS